MSAHPRSTASGNVYGASEEGYLYVVDRYGHLPERDRSGRSPAEACTPIALDAAGRVYTQNNGDLYALAFG